MSKKYKIGLFGELISESSISNILEQGGFDFSAAKSSPAPDAAKPAATAVVNSKSPDTKDEMNRKKDEAVVLENFKKFSTKIDTLFIGIYDNLKELYNTGSSEFSNWDPHQATSYAWYDDESDAMKDIFGTDTIFNDSWRIFWGLDIPDNDQGYNGRWWREKCVPNLNEIEKLFKKLKAELDKRSKESPNKVYEEDVEFVDLISKAKDQCYSVWKDIITKSMKYSARSTYNFTYTPTRRAYDSTAPTKSYSLYLDF